MALLRPPILRNPPLSSLLPTRLTRTLHTTTLNRASTPLKTPYDPPILKTPLHDLHLRHSATLTPFAGYSMPLLYASQSHLASHSFTRHAASLFDVSHMVQQRISGPGAARFLERVTPCSAVGLRTGKSQLTVLLHDRSGGIVDDAMVTRVGEAGFYVVSNAACREKDGRYFGRELAKWHDAHPGDEHAVSREVLPREWGLLAVQGPLSAEILHSVLADPASLDLKALHFGDSAFTRFKLLDDTLSENLMISRCGYTGEDGFEVSIPPGQSEAVAETLLDRATPERLQLAGLAARDSLRLEAGMCLYGHDLDDRITPVEADLSFIIKKDRRTVTGKDAAGAFYGADVILPQLKMRSDSKGRKIRNTKIKRVGIVTEGPPAREGAEVFDENGERKIGSVTSGCPSPTLGKNIAMGYVKNGELEAGVGDRIAVNVRGKMRRAEIVAMPFVPTRYWKGIAPA